MRHALRKFLYNFWRSHHFAVAVSCPKWAAMGTAGVIGIGWCPKQAFSGTNQIIPLSRTPCRL